MSDRQAKLKKRLTTNWPKGRQVLRTLGEGPAGQLFDIILGGDIVRPQIKDARKSDEEVLKIVDLFLDRELENVARTGQTLSVLASRLTSGKLAGIARNDAMDPGAYGARAEDSETMKAARWVNHASTTTRGTSGSLIETNNIIAMASSRPASSA